MDYEKEMKERFLQELAMDFMHRRECNFYAKAINFELKIYGGPVIPESIWYSDKDDKIYIHCGCKEFEGDLDIDSLSDENQAVLRKVFEENI